MFAFILSIFINYNYNYFVKSKKHFKKCNFLKKHFKIFKTPVRMSLIFLSTVLMVNENTIFRDVLKGFVGLNSHYSRLDHSYIFYKTVLA